MLQLFLELAESTTNDFLISGSINSWGRKVESILDLIIVLECPREERLRRITLREMHRFGSVNREFYEWASGYEEGLRPGRSLPRHLLWLERLHCPYFLISSVGEIDDMANSILEKLSKV